MDLLIALATGLIVGAVFAFVNVAPPAPDNWAGVVGIIGIVAGWTIVGLWK